MLVVFLYGGLQLLKREAIYLVAKGRLSHCLQRLPGFVFVSVSCIVQWLLLGNWFLF
jgi:hypothetical protein